MATFSGGGFSGGDPPRTPTKPTKPAAKNSRYCFICDKGALSTHYVSLLPSTQNFSAGGRKPDAKKKTQLLDTLRSILGTTIDSSATWGYICNSCRKKAEKISEMDSNDRKCITSRNMFVNSYKETKEKHRLPRTPSGRHPLDRHKRMSTETPKARLAMDDSMMTPDKLEEIRSRMKEKRKKAARIAGMNGSWNKSFGKKRRCPNASVILKVSLKANNRALAKSLQVLKQENRMQQDMIINLQTEHQMLLQKIYQLKQNDKENMRLRKEIQGALNDVTSSLLTVAGTKLAYAMKLTTSYPIRDSLRSSTELSDDDSIYMKNRSSSISTGPSMYYRENKSERLPTPPPISEPDLQQPINQPPPTFPCREQPSPNHFLPPREDCSPSNLPEGDDHVMEIEDEMPDPAAECLDPSMIKDLDFDFPLMFTDDDDLNPPDDEPKVVDEDSHAIKRRTRSSRTSNLIDPTSIGINTRRTRSMAKNLSRPPSANTHNRVTFVVPVAQDILESSEDDQPESQTQQLEAPTTSILNQTFEIESKDAEENVVGEKTTYTAEDMELTGPFVASEELKQQESNVTKKKATKGIQMKDNSREDIPVKSKSTDDVPKVLKSSKNNIQGSKKSKLPMKKAHTKVSIKKKDFKETFQSPKSPLMSPGITKSTNSLSFRCVPSPVFGRTAKREAVSRFHEPGKADMSVGSVFDLSEGDTFTEAKSILMPASHEPVIAECSDDKTDISEENMSAGKDDIMDEKKEPADDSNKKKPTDDGNNKKKRSKLRKAAENKKATKVGKKDTVAKETTDIEIVELSSAETDEQANKKNDAIDTKIKRRSRISKSVAKVNNAKLLEQVSDSESDKGNSKKDEQTKKTDLFPVNDQEEDASMFFITKPMIHRASKKKADSKLTNPDADISAKSSENDKSGKISQVDVLTDEQISDILQDIEMVAAPDNPETKASNCKKETKSKVKKKKKLSSIPVPPKTISKEDTQVLVEPNIEHENDQDGKDSDPINIDSEKPSVGQRRSTRRSSGSPVIHQSRRGRKRRFKIESDNEDSADEDVDAFKRARRSSSAPVGKQRRLSAAETEQEEEDTQRVNGRHKQSRSRSRGASVTHKQTKQTASENDKGKIDDQGHRELKMVAELAEDDKVEEVVKVNKSGKSRSEQANGQNRKSKSKKKPAAQPEEEDDVEDIVMVDKRVKQRSEQENGQNKKSKSIKKSAAELKKDEVEDIVMDDKSLKPRSEQENGQNKKSKSIKKSAAAVSKRKKTITMETDNDDKLLEEKQREDAEKLETLSRNNGGSEAVTAEPTAVLVEAHENKRLTHFIKKRPSCSDQQKKLQRVSWQSLSQGETEQQSKAEVKDLGGRRTSRRAAGAVNYAEPKIGSKLRRGDPHTSNEFLKPADIYKSAEDKAKKKKLLKGDNRKPLGNVQNTLRAPEPIEEIMESA